MAYDAYLQFSTSNTVYLQGESTRQGSEGTIEIEGFDFDVENTVSIGSGTTGAAAGKVQFNAFTVVKRPDKSSPLLFQYCSSGQHFEDVSVVLNKAGGGAAVPYLRFHFKVVFITKVEWSARPAQGDTPTETVHFEYGGLVLEYTPQKVDGTSGSAVLGGWSRITNSKPT